MDDLISRLSEIRSEYNCFDENEEPYYRALSEAIKILSRRADGDTISRQAAIDMFQNLAYDDWNQGVSTSWADAYSECADMIRELPSAQPELLAHGEGELSAQPEQRWIPCSERLPDGRLNKSYLVQDKDGRRAVGTYTNWGWVFGQYMNDPVAWMPLPKPYERKEE